MNGMDATPESEARDPMRSAADAASDPRTTASDTRGANALRLGIIGSGRAAWTFGSTWRRIGWPLAGLATRSDTRVASLLGTSVRTIESLAADTDLLLVAVSDRAIEEVARSIPQTRAIIMHPSGALASVRGGFSLHPLRALPQAGEPADLEGTLLVFEGAHREVAEAIAAAAGARLAAISADAKERYHAAAVFGSNYVAALLDIAEELIGIENVRGDLAALARSAIDNWLVHDDHRRFTGPAARGEHSVMERHLGALAAMPELAVIYQLLAARIVAARK